MSAGNFMLDLFRAEARKHGAALTAGLPGLEKKGGSPGALEPLLLAAHSIKGAAQIVGISAAAKLALLMEDLLAAAQKTPVIVNSAAVAALLEGSDILQRIGSSEISPAGLPPQELLDAVGLIAPKLEALLETKPEPAAQPAFPAPAPAAAPPQAEGLKVDLAMLGLFRDEVQNRCAALSDGLLGLEKKGASNETVEPLMRAAHSIKGAARIAGVNAVVQVAHLMEDCFVSAQKGGINLSPSAIDVLLQGSDMIRNAALSIDDSTGAVPEEIASAGRDLLPLLSAVLSGKEPEKPGPLPQASVQNKPPAPSAGKETERVVRVSSESMVRLMSLSGDALVQTGRLDLIFDGLTSLGAGRREIGALMRKAGQALEKGDAAAAAEALGQAYALNAAHSGNIAERINDFDQTRRRIFATAGRLYGEVIKSKMRPFADCAHGFPRMIRDAAKIMGKRVRLEISGGATGVDRDILEKVEAPLTHLLRNAVDHGIEGPGEREKSGKPAEGVISLEAWQAGGLLHILVSDDGAGIDINRLKDKIVAKKLTSPELAAKMSESELLEFLFLPGFSTKEEVTEFSGRGVGLDVVETMLREVGGTVLIENRPGLGTRISLRLPLSLSVIRALIAEISGQPYAFALTHVDRCLRLEPGGVIEEGNAQFVEVDGRKTRLLPAWQVMDLPEPGAAGAGVCVIIIAGGQSQFALQVDRFLDERDVAVRPLDPRLAHVQDISAASVMDDGSALLIADVDDLQRTMELFVSEGGLTLRAAGSAQLRKRILVVDDSPTVRAVQRQLLEKNGYEVALAVNGADGWYALRAGNYDLLISDMDMPRANGIDLINMVRAEPGFQKLPIIIVSYKDTEDDRRRAMEAGANDYLSKSSFHDNTLLKKITELLNGAGQ